jgi:hypothetical protein
MLALLSFVRRMISGHGKSVPPQFLDLLHNLGGQNRLRTKPNLLNLGLVDAVLLALSGGCHSRTRVKDAHDQLPGARGCVDA